MVNIFLSVLGNYVSLPGSGTGPTEQPTILLINGIADETQLLDKQAKAAALKLALNSNESQITPGLVPTTPGGSHLLDFESHLIEDVNAEDSGVGIRELTPFEQELERGPSKIETDDASRVIEVEPAGAKTKQIVETLGPPHQIAEVDETATSSDLVRQTAEQLVNEIEKELIETLSKNVDEAKTEHDNQVQSELNELNSLSQQVDVQLNELTSILKVKSQPEIILEQLAIPTANELKLVEVPTPKTEAEEQQRKEFIDSLPQIEHNRLEPETDAQRLSADCKREYYQSLKKYLLDSSQDKPPVPLQTYRWEDLRRARERGGYPWTHLYKRPLGPDEQPEIVLLLRKSQELRFKSESPKSLKKVRYDEQVLVKETERYIQDLSEDEAVATTTDDSSSEESSDSETESEREREAHNEDALSECISCVSDSVLAVGGHAKPRKTNRLAQIRNIIKRRRSGRTQEDAQSLPGSSANPSRQNSLHELAPPPGALKPNTEQPKKAKPGFDIMKKLKSLAERQKKRLNIKRITLKKEDKIVLGEQQKIMRLKASPKSDRGEIPHFIEKQDSDDILELVEYDESPCRKRNKEELEQEREDLPSTSAASVPELEEIIELPVEKVEAEVAAPALEVTEPTTPEVEEEAPPKKTPRLRREHVYEEIGQSDPQLPGLELDTLKKSLIRQDHLTLEEVEAAKPLPLDRMGSSEEEQAAALPAEKSTALLAPLSSIDSTSSDEDRARLAQLSPVVEESDEPLENSDLRPALKKEASPAPSDKKVTFSHVEDEAEPHREDIELPEDILEAATNAAKWKTESDHEYEPVGVSPVRQSSPGPTHNGQSPPPQLPLDIDMQLSSAGTTPCTVEIHTSQVDSSALEELPLQPDNRKKSFMASAQDRTKKMHDGLRLQAGKLRTKLGSASQPKAKSKPISSSPKAKAKERRRFKAPEFSKIKMPEIKRPDMSKFKELKRPEFTKFNKPDMSKFKLPEKFTTLKLRRSKSFKENESEQQPMEEEAAATSPQPAAPKKKFEFNFGTYPRAFRKKKPAEEPVPIAIESSLGTEGLSVIPSTETQPSQTSTSSPQGDRGPGPVRSRWADKFSDVSYNDSEGSRYRRYGSELESFDRESSLERRMKEDLEGTAEDTASEAQPQTEMGILGGVADSKQFAEFNEENRAIHEISSQRSREFKRRPMVHQDSDLRSEDSRDAEGWTEKDIQKNKLLRKAELEADTAYYKFHDRQDAQSTASSGKKVVMEPIDDDEFFLRKRGISEDNIQLRQYISAAIREGYELPNALQNVGHSDRDRVRSEEYGDYDVPPPKPRRLHRNYRPDYDDSQEFQRSDYGDDLSMSQNGSDFLPKRPLRKGRSKYSVDGSEDIPMADGGSSIQYFDDDEDYLRPPMRDERQGTETKQSLNNFNRGEKTSVEETDAVVVVQRPQAPKRQKKRTRDDSSVEKDADSFINGFGGRSVSNTFLQPQEDVIVYRTEHEYHHIPLATPDNFTDGASARTQRSEDERTSRGADSLILGTKRDESHALRTEDDEKFVIEMLESDGYAVVRKEPIPKPTPPARRKKFTRSPGERFATLPSIRGSRGSPPPARPPPPLQYIPSEDSPLVMRHRAAASLEEIPSSSSLLLKSNYDTQMQQEKPEEDDYEEPEALERPESPRSNLQSGEVINKMKFRPLPAPPRPPREKRSTRGGSGALDNYEDSERVASSSTADSYDQGEFEVEVSTQTDPLPDDFVCEEFEITEDMKIIEPRRSNGAGLKTLEDILRNAQSQDQDEVDGGQVLTENEQLARGLQRFRDANQRSLSERSRASSQADRSKSLSRPVTPSSAVVIERRVPTPSLVTGEDEALVQAALIVRPISAADLEDEELRREEEELRREGLLSDSSVQSKSDVETAGEEDEDRHGVSDLDAAVEQLQQAQLESDYESKLEDDEVERTLRESEYEEEEEAGEKYSDQYEEEEEEEEAELEKQLTEQELDEALEKQLQEEMEKELAAYRQKEKELAAADEGHPLSEEELVLSDVEHHFSEEEHVLSEVEPALSELEHPFSEEEPALSEVEQPFSEEEPAEHPLLKTEQPVSAAVEEPFHRTTASEPTEAEVELKFVATLPTEPAYSQDELAEEDEEVTATIPLPPPRRKSTTALEPSTLTIAEQFTRELTPIQSLQSPPEMQLPTHLGELEVDRLRVHALQAGQIQVSQLHGSQIKADDLECKSGQLVVQNIELPPGFIDDIVERVREQRPSLLTTETQTSRQPSSEPAASEVDQSPPTKPPRQSKANDLSVPNLDEQTQTDEGILPLPPPPAAYPSVEYLQSLAPLAFYNLQRSAEAEQLEASTERKAPHKCRRRHVHEQALEPESGSDLEDQLVERPRSRSRRSRTRSATQPPEDYDEDQPKTVAQAGRQFISACSLELVSIITQLTQFVRGETALEPQQQPRNISALMMLFILITFGVLVFLLTGRQVHTHHWDYFNPPGNEGRQT